MQNGIKLFLQCFFLVLLVRTHGKDMFPFGQIPDNNIKDRVGIVMEGNFFPSKRIVAVWLTPLNSSRICPLSPS